MSIDLGPVQPIGRPLLPARLRQPVGLPDGVWLAIAQTEQRLLRAELDGDRPLVVGCAKELVEAVAKAVMQARTGTAGAKIEFGPMLTAAHKALDMQPGQGLASDPATAALAGSVKQVAYQLGDLRNQVGTGHGKAHVAAVFDETVELAVTCAMAWCRWALRRLEHMMAGQLEPLILDLTEGARFSAGSLAARLIAADLGRLESSQAHRLGLAVGQRAASGTFVVDEDGVRQCALSDDLTRWPVAYREGAALGLLLNRDGYLSTSPGRIGDVASLLSAIPSPDESVRYLVDALAAAPLEQRLAADSDQRRAIVAAFDEAGRVLGASDAWSCLRGRFESAVVL